MSDAIGSASVGTKEPSQFDPVCLTVECGLVAKLEGRVRRSLAFCCIAVGLMLLWSGTASAQDVDYHCDPNAPFIVRLGEAIVQVSVFVLLAVGSLAGTWFALKEFFNRPSWNTGGDLFDSLMDIGEPFLILGAGLGAAGACLFGASSALSCESGGTATTIASQPPSIQESAGELPPRGSSPECSAAFERAKKQARATRTEDWTFWLQPQERERCLQPGSLGASLRDQHFSESCTPSFDCNVDRRPADQLVCRTPSLCEMDQKMAAQFEYLRATIEPEQFRRVREDQLNWWRYRRNLCRDVSCLFQAYQERLRELGAH